MLENTERAIKNEQSRETDNVGCTWLRTTKQKHNTICVGHHYMQANTHNVYKTTKELNMIANSAKVTFVNRKLKHYGRCFHS